MNLKLKIFLLAMFTALSTYFSSSICLAIGGGGEFESRMQSLTGLFINIVLPMLAVGGLLYAVFLALTGEAAAKSRLIMVGVCSVVGFLAPHIINFLKMAAGY